MAKCSKYHAKCKVTMPKFSKYHAKWQVLVPNCCKYKANGTGKENQKNIQNLRQKIPKTILHPFRAAEWLALKAKRLCPYRWHFNVEWKTMENQCLSFRVVHFKTFASLQPSILVADFSLPQQSLPFLWPLFEQVGFLRSGLPLPPDISRNLQNAAGQPHQSFPRSWNRPQDSRGGGGGYGGYGLLLQCCDIEHCRNCCENCTELWLSARPGTKSLNNQLEG